MKIYIALILFLITIIFIYQKNNQNHSFIKRNNIPYFYEKNTNFKVYPEEKNRNNDMKIYEIMNENLYKK